MRLVKFSGWSIALALGHIMESDRRFAFSRSEDLHLDRIFSVDIDPPDPETILPLHLVRWAVDDA